MDVVAGLEASALLAVEGETGGLTQILPASAELFYGALSFVIVYFVLDRYAFPMLNRVLDERTRSIQGRLEDAEHRLAEAEETRATYERQLAEARTEANRIIEEARETGEALRRDIVERAEEEAQSIVQRAQREVGAERDRALQQLRSEVGRLSVDLASRIVERELDQASHQDLVDRYISRLSGAN